ncbi:hypothetical protein bcgnr5390_16080 [Bacillus luti]|nr:hypothetical protein BC2903_53340 [Bacillus cereus]
MKTTTNTTITAKDMTFEGMAPNKPRSSVHKDKEAGWGFVYDAKRQDRIEDAKNLGTKDGLKGKNRSFPKFGKPKQYVAAAVVTGLLVVPIQSPVFADADLEYQVTAGESLESIAKDHGISVDQLKSANDKTVIDNFHDGIELRVPDNSYKPNRENAEKYQKEHPEIYKDGMPKTLTKEMQEKLAIGKPAYEEQGVEIQEEKQQPVAPKQEVKPQVKEQQPVAPKQEVKPQVKEQQPVAPKQEVKPQVEEQQPVAPKQEVKPQEQKQPQVVNKPAVQQQVQKEDVASTPVVKQVNNVKPVNAANKVVNTNSNNNEIVVDYVVKKGDNLWKIARKYSTTVEELRSSNGISSNNVIYPNQHIKISVDFEGKNVAVAEVSKIIDNQVQFKTSQGTYLLLEVPNQDVIQELQNLKGVDLNIVYNDSDFSNVLYKFTK